ncbi:MAG TPA: hypothetical protein VMY99_01415 [Nevskiaceae bacterium]|nr:hypothetical protein [Nevskiaceae bacterium]
MDKALVDKVATYQPDPTKLKILHDTPVLLLVAASGTGKDSLKARLLDRYADQYYKIITHITRPPRSNNGVIERDGVEYHFIDLAAAERMLDNHDYFEAAVYVGNIYGTSAAEIQLAHDQHKIALADVEVNGADHFASLSATVKPVFVLPPSYEEWQRRLTGRYGDKKGDFAADLAKRMRTAKVEFERALTMAHYYLVINDDLDKAAEQVNAIAHSSGPVQRDPQALAVLHGILERLTQELRKTGP